MQFGIDLIDLAASKGSKPGTAAAAAAAGQLFFPSVFIHTTIFYLPTHTHTHTHTHEQIKSKDSLAGILFLFCWHGNLI
jgi:hypothetical protein